MRNKGNREWVNSHYRFSREKTQMATTQAQNDEFPARAADEDVFGCESFLALLFGNAMQPLHLFEFVTRESKKAGKG